MIQLGKTRQMSDIIHNSIPYSGLESAIISTPIFNRLHRILQSSLVYLTYSSNKVKRFEHSVGTMHLAGEIFYNSIANTTNSLNISRLFSEAETELKKWFKNLDAPTEKMLNNSIVCKFDDKVLTVKVPDSTIYRMHFPQNVDKEHNFAYFVLFQSVRIAGLLHDAGHLPYSHVFEHAAESLYSRIESIQEPNKSQKSFLEILKPYYSNKNKLHEEIGNALLKQIKIELTEELSKNITQDNIFVLATLYFVDKILKSHSSDNNLFSDLHRIVSGIFDADRLDYCSRDAFCAGTRKDIISYQRLFNNFKIISQILPADIDDKKTVGVRERILFCPALKNVTDVEELLERRWKIFSQINFHHKVHKHEILFSEVLSYIGLDELEKLGEDDIPSINDGQPLPLKLYSIWYLIYLLSINNRLIDYLIIQLDDSWMDTLLKVSFFDHYSTSYRDETSNSQNYMWYMFDELISTKKHYHSLFKRNVDFVDFDETLKNLWLKESANFDNSPMEIIYKGTATKIQEKNHYQVGYVFHTILDSFLSKSTKNLFYQCVERKINNYLSTEEGKTLNILHCIIRGCDINLGCFDIGSPLYLWDKEEKGCRMETVSICGELLEKQKSSYVPFHLYFLPLPSNDPNLKPNLKGLEKVVVNAFVDELKNIKIDSVPKS